MALHLSLCSPLFSRATALFSQHTTAAGPVAHTALAQDLVASRLQNGVNARLDVGSEVGRLARALLLLGRELTLAGSRIVAVGGKRNLALGLGVIVARLALRAHSVAADLQRA
jgi:hypothetical protein